MRKPYTVDDIFYDVDNIRTGRSGIRRDSYEKSTAIIIGVQHTGSQDGNNGWALRQVTAASPLEAATLDTVYFDEHPCYQFDDYTGVDDNKFRRIPIAYWWRGMLPDVADGVTERWTMLMSNEPVTRTISGVECEFKASPGAFKRDGSWMEQFYIGTYRGHNAGNNKVGSKAGQTAWGNVTFTNFKTYCENNGSGYHLLSLQEWQEICARAVIEKGTFQIMPESIRATQASCKYRGIEDFAFSGTVYAEWMDGARTDGSGNYQLWEESGGSYVTTTSAAAVGSGETTYYTNALYSKTQNALFDNMFLASSMGTVGTSMIPDYSGRPSGYVSCVCYSSFDASLAYYGAFYSRFGSAASASHAAIGGRLAKW